MGQPKILYSGGYWATNIGNAFYELGIRYLLSHLNSNPIVYYSSDQPYYYWNIYNGKGATSFNYLSDVNNVDYLVIAGPLLDEGSLKCWERDLEIAEERNIKIVFLSAGG